MSEVRILNSLKKGDEILFIGLKSVGEDKRGIRNNKNYMEKKKKTRKPIIRTNPITR